MTVDRLNIGSDAAEVFYLGHVAYEQMMMMMMCNDLMCT